MFVVLCCIYVSRMVHSFNTEMNNTRRIHVAGGNIGGEKSLFSSTTARGAVLLTSGEQGRKARPVARG